MGIQRQFSRGIKHLFIPFCFLFSSSQWAHATTYSVVEYVPIMVSEITVIIPIDNDQDNDLLPDDWEVLYGFNPAVFDNANADPDGDGLSTLTEVDTLTNPNNADTDADSLNDGYEITHGFDPLTYNSDSDPDGDGLSTLIESQIGTDPGKPDTDNDGLDDGTEYTYGFDPLDGTDAPDFSLTLSHHTVAYNGFSIASWSAVTATHCSGSDGFSTISTLSGSLAISNLTSNRTINLTCVYGGLPITKSVTIIVSPGVAVNFSPSVVPYGGSATVTWNADSATSCSGTDGISGTSGSQLFSGLTADTTITVNCSGGGGPSSQSVTIPVELPVEVTPTAPAEFTVPNMDFDGTYTISWAASQGNVTHYKLYEKTTNNWQLVYSGPDLSYLVTANTDGTFEYSLTACNGDLCSDHLYRYVSVVYGFLKKPGPLVISNIGNIGNYNISWPGPHGYVQNYVLEESSNSGPWKVISNSLATQVNINSQLSGVYKYRVKACNSYDCSNYSPEVSIEIIDDYLSTPAPVVVPTINHSGDYHITWSDNQTYAENYVLEESYNDGPWHVISNNSTMLAAVNSQLSGDYRYRLRACGYGHCSGYSQEVGMTVIRSVPIEREQPLLVVLVSYQDSEITSTEEEWANKFFGKSEGQLNHYFAENSKERFQLKPVNEPFGVVNDGIAHVTLPFPHTRVTVGHNKEYYAILDILDADINFSDYDTNQDGIVSNSEFFMFMIIDGYAYSPGNPIEIRYEPKIRSVTIGVVQMDEFSPGLYRDEIVIDADHILNAQGNDLLRSRVCVVAEKIGHSLPFSNHPYHEWVRNIGVLAHELVHGIVRRKNGPREQYIPDLYRYQTSSMNEGVGIFGLMGNGSHGFKNPFEHRGETPTHMSAWTKINAGFMSGDGEILVVKPGEHLTDIQLWGTGTGKYNIVKVETSQPNEYFLIENLAAIGYGRGLKTVNSGPLSISPEPAVGGIAIWHIDDNMISNNDDGYHKLVDFEEAVQSMGMGSGTDEMLYRNGNQTEFSDFTTPTNARLYIQDGNGNPMCSGLRVYGISEAGKVMTINIDYTMPSGPCPE